MSTSGSIIGTEPVSPGGVIAIPIQQKLEEGEVYLGYDTEWEKALSKDKNHILSYQYSVVGPDRRRHDGLIVAEARRLSFSRYVSIAINTAIEAGILKKWPTKIVMCVHWSRADLYSLRDFQEWFKHKFDNIRRTYVSTLQDTHLRCYDRSDNPKVVRVKLRDSLLLAPAGFQRLSDVGELIGEKKIELNPGEIEHMGRLFTKDRQRFDDYAIQDAVISVEYVLRMRDLSLELFGESDVPCTLSSFGVKYLFKLWKEKGIDRHQVLGTEAVDVSFFDTTSRSQKPKKEILPIDKRYKHESFVTETFHGGRNEQYIFGASSEAVWTDYDLCGAYTTALSLIGIPRYEDIYESRNLEDYQPETLGFATVEFSFPQGTRFPSLPVEAKGSLVFPLRGLSKCTATEIYAARARGADIKILEGVILPADRAVKPFQEFVKDGQARRREAQALYGKKSLRAEFWKELLNSVYGKTCQGLRKKRHFNSRIGEYETLPPSPITNPYLASFVTGLVRAALGEMLSRLPDTVEVSNATTDGLLTTATKAEMEYATQGDVCRLYAKARIELCGNDQVIEVKHQIKQLLGMRTRGQVTLKGIKDQPFVMAKCGLKPPMQDRSQQNRWIVKLFCKRSYKTTISVKYFRQLPEMWFNGGDFGSREMERKVTLDFDWKRRADTRGTRAILKKDHLYFNTLPWETIDEYFHWRESWDEFKKMEKCVLRTEDDLARFEIYAAIPREVGVRRYTDEAAEKLGLRTLRRALVKEKMGLSMEGLTYVEAAKWLRSGKYKTTREDLENAKRKSAILEDNKVPRTPKTEKLAAFVSRRFPGFDPTSYFVNSPYAYEIAA